MRNPKRIKPFLEKVEEAWSMHPDWRFGQFMCNFFGECNRDPFFAEEDEWEVALQAYIDGKNPGEAMDNYLDEKYGG